MTLLVLGWGACWLLTPILVGRFTDVYVDSDGRFDGWWLFWHLMFGWASWPLILAWAVARGGTLRHLRDARKLRELEAAEAEELSLLRAERRRALAQLEAEL